MLEIFNAFKNSPDTEQPILNPKFVRHVGFVPQRI